MQQIQQNKKIVRKKILHKNASPSFDFNKVKINLSTIDKSKTNQLKECSVILEKIDLSKFLYKNSCNLCKIKNNSLKRCNKNK